MLTHLITITTQMLQQHSVVYAGGYINLNLDRCIDTGLYTCRDTDISMRVV